MTRPRIFLHTLDSEMAVAWRSVLTGGAGVIVVEGDILEGRCDALVSPSNSFGFMDGGIDLAYLRHFGNELQSRVQSKSRAGLLGEIPVGPATTISVGHDTAP